MKKTVKSYRVSTLTLRQLADLGEWFVEENQTRIIEIAVDRLHTQERSNRVKMSCRNCGGQVAEWSEVKAAVQKEYNFTDDELDNNAVVVKVYHPACAVADHRVDNESEVDGAFYWEAHRQ